MALSTWSRLLWRLLLGLASTAFMLGLLMLGLVLGLAVYLWARLRGRPAASLHFGWQQAGRRAGANGSAARNATHGEVVDVEAREVTTDSRRLPATQPAGPAAPAINADGPL